MLDCREVTDQVAHGRGHVENEKGEQPGKKKDDIRAEGDNRGDDLVPCQR